MELLIRWTVTPGHIDRIEGNEEAAAKHGSSPNRKLPSQLRKTQQISGPAGIPRKIEASTSSKGVAKVTTVRADEADRPSATI
jgi:hypothetical protein